MNLDEMRRLRDMEANAVELYRETAPPERQLSSASAAQVIWMLDVLIAIEELREEEVSSVTIVNDNQDFGGPASLVKVAGEWTGYDERTFYGESLLDCLTKAVKSKVETTAK